MRLAGKVALVTGAQQGIGKAIALAYGREGASVVINYVDGRAAAEEIASRILALGQKAVVVAGDVSKAADVERLLEAGRTLGGVDVLVNNAGIFPRVDFLRMTEAQWDEVLDVNLGGTFRCCRAVLPGMVYRRRGAIVSISSRSAEAGLPGQSAYAASKAGLMGLTRSLAREIGRKGIRVNVIVPGFVATEQTAALPEARVTKLRDTECLPAGTAPRDVAHMVAFLLSDRAAAITGQAVAVDAGASA